MNANPQSAIPLYFQIEQDLASLITSGTLAPGSQLPSEEELVQRYGVSRTTVRKAVQELDRLGLIEIRRGRGTFVRTGKITQEFTELTGFVEDMVAMGLQPSAKVLGTAPVEVAEQALDANGDGTNRISMVNLWPISGIEPRGTGTSARR